MDTEKNIVVAGIDYSMTSPAICVHVGSEWSLDNCKFYYLTSSKKFEIESAQFSGKLHQPFESQEERFYNNALWATGCLRARGTPSLTLIEGYAMGAKGRVFHIGENTGMLKHVLWDTGVKFYVEAPSEIKKKATGKGNANKERMEEAFFQETGFDVRSFLGQTPGTFTPSSDIIDSYWMAKIAFQREAAR